MTLYPNLVELIKYYPCHETTVCDYAEIEPEVLHAVMNDGEELRYMELVGLSRLYECQIGVLTHHKVIMMDMRRWKHKKMAGELDFLYVQIRLMAGREDNERAKGCLERAEWVHQRFLKAVCENKLSYGHYLGSYERLSSYAAQLKPKPKRRSLASA